MNLQDEGFRFVFAANDYTWTHPLMIPAGAIDCTDMDDAQFADFVIANVGGAA